MEEIPPSVDCYQGEQQDGNGNQDVNVNYQNSGNNNINLFTTVDQSERSEMMEMEQMTAGMGLMTMTGSNLQHVSSGVWSCVSYYQNQEQLEEGAVDDYEVGASVASWENNAGTESDYYNDSDFNELSDAGEENEPENEDEDEEVEESCEEDESLILEAIDDLQVKFEQLVGQTITQAETFLDDANLLKHLAVHSKLSLSSQFQPLYEAMTAVNDNSMLEKVHCEQTSSAVVSNTQFGKNVETQTDFDDAYLTRSSGTLVPPSNEALGEDLGIEQAQLELEELHALRDGFLSELKNRKADVAGQNRSKEEDPEERRKLCQMEESLEAIDKAIEFKSEIQGAGALPTLSPEEHLEFPDLVTQLEVLSMSDLQRLVGVYFNKAVELRHSSSELEKSLERASKKHDDYNRRYTREKKHTRELQEQHQSRILEFLCSHADPSYYSKFRRKEEQLQAARKKQQDLEQSLTALLVRHGYLLDGVDYDVKQVVRTLGIDESQLAAGPMMMDTAKGRITRRGGISDAVEHVDPDRGIPVAEATRQHFPRDNAFEIPPPPRRDRESGNRDTAKFKGGRQSTRTVGFDHDPRNRAFPPFVAPPTSNPSSSSATQVVTRQKGRIIIQPNANPSSAGASGAPSTSYGYPPSSGGGPSSGTSSRHRNTNRR